MDVIAYLEYAGSVTRTATLLEAGFSERAIRKSLAAGEIARLRHGVVALHGAAPDLVGAVLANGLLSCTSAAPHHGSGGSMNPHGCTCCAGTVPRPVPSSTAPAPFRGSSRAPWPD